jgi:hypothetical protein
VLLLVLALGADRPREHRFVTKPTETSPAFALLLRLPPGWECREVPGSFPWNETPGDAILVKLWHTAEKGSGLEQVPDRLAIGDPGQAVETYTITLQTGPPGSIAEYSVQTLQRFLRNHNAQGDNVTTFRTVQHAIGPAFDEMCAPWLGPPATSVDKNLFSIPDGVPERHRVTHLFLRKHPTGPWVRIEASDVGPKADFSGADSPWEEIVRSIRVMQQ